MSVASLLGPAVQLAYAVPDLIEAARRWTAETGAGPFFVRPTIAVVDVTYRGRPATFDHGSAYGQAGGVMIELVHDRTVGPSVVRDAFPDGGSGLHHLAYIVDDPAAAIAALARQGHELAMSASTAGGVEFHFVDARSTHGHFLELYPPVERLRRFYAMVAEAAEGWDGSDPIRMLD